MFAFHFRCIFLIALQTMLSWKHTIWALIKLRPSENWSGSIMSGGLKTNIEMKQTAYDNQYIPVLKLLTGRKATARSLYHRLGVTAGWPSDVRTILWALQGASCDDLAGSLRLCKSLRSFFAQNVNLKSCVVLTITVRCPYGDRTMLLRRVYGLRAYDFFKLVIVRS